MSISPISPYPVGIPRVGNVTPFTYRSGATYLEILETLSHYIRVTLIPNLNELVGGNVDDLNAQLQTYVDDIERRIMAINNRVGPESTNRMTIAAPLVVNVDTAWPDEHPIDFQVRQNVVGGHQITFGAGITGVVATQLQPNALTEFTLIPDGTGWYVSQLPTTANGLTAFIGVIVNPIAATVAAQLAAQNESVDERLALTEEALANVSQRGADNGFIMSTFLGNGVAAEKLALFYSPDGKTLFGGADNPAYVPVDGEGVRDPSILFHNGRWFITYTTDNGLDKDIHVATSENTYAGTWTLLATINAAAIPNIKQAWAPEFVVDGNDVYIFFSRVSTANLGNMHWVRANNAELTSWTAPTALNFPTAPVHYIDGIPVKHTDDKWYMFFSTGDAVERAVSNTLTGQYVADRFGNWANWGTGIEGPFVIRDKDRYRIYFDRFVVGTGVHWSESFDLNAWSVPVPLRTAPFALRDGESIRHGSFFPLSEPISRNQIVAVHSMPVSRIRNTEFATGPNGMQLESGLVKPINDLFLDEFETEDNELVSYANGIFTLNEKCTYNIQMSGSITEVTGVNRSFIEMVNVNGTLTHMRQGNGAEDVAGFAFPNFKPREAGEQIRLRIFGQWTGGQVFAKVNARIRFTRA